jgi:hypothetical protein
MAGESWARRLSMRPGALSGRFGVFQSGGGGEMLECELFFWVWRSDLEKKSRPHGGGYRCRAAWAEEETRAGDLDAYNSFGMDDAIGGSIQFPGFFS